MFKHAQELLKGDRFSMAAAHYHVLGIYEVDNEHQIRVAFAPVTGIFSRNTMTVDKELLFHLL